MGFRWGLGCSSLRKAKRTPAKIGWVDHVDIISCVGKVMKFLWFSGSSWCQQEINVLSGLLCIYSTQMKLLGIMMHASTNKCEDHTMDFQWNKHLITTEAGSTCLISVTTATTMVKSFIFWDLPQPEASPPPKKKQNRIPLSRPQIVRSASKITQSLPKPFKILENYSKSLKNHSNNWKKYHKSTIEKASQKCPKAGIFQAKPSPTSPLLPAPHVLRGQQRPRMATYLVAFRALRVAGSPWLLDLQAATSILETNSR